MGLTFFHISGQNTGVGQACKARPDVENYVEIFSKFFSNLATFPKARVAQLQLAGL